MLLELSPGMTVAAAGDACIHLPLSRVLSLASVRPHPTGDQDFIGMRSSYWRTEEGPPTDTRVR